MCLSDVYSEGAEKSFLFKNIAGAEINGDELVFTDLMGVRHTVKGHIVSIDLIENRILIKENGI